MITSVIMGTIEKSDLKLYEHLAENYYERN